MAIHLSSFLVQDFRITVSRFQMLYRIFFSILQQRQQQGGGPGLRIASVSSLQKPQKQSPVSLPSSISISRVQNEQQAPQVRQVQQRLPPGTMISGQRPGPRGAGPGMGAGPRGGMRPGMGMMGRGMAPGGQRMPYMNGGGGVKRPGGAVNPGLATNYFFYFGFS